MYVKDLVHRFLLDSGFTRASLMADPEELYLNGDQAQSYRPAFLVIDPENGDPLAVIDVSSNERGDQVADRAEKSARYARKTDGNNVQAFVITVDKGSANTAEQVRFVRVWPNKEYQNVSTQMFPDLEALVLARKLALKKSKRVETGTVEMEIDEEDDYATGRRRIWVPYVLAILLLLLAAVDWFLQFSRGIGLLDLPQLLLIVVAAVLLCLPQLVRRDTDL